MILHFYRTQPYRFPPLESFFLVPSSFFFSLLFLPSGRTAAYGGLHTREKCNILRIGTTVCSIKRSNSLLLPGHGRDGRSSIRPPFKRTYLFLTSSNSLMSQVIGEFSLLGLENRATLRLSVPTTRALSSLTVETRLKRRCTPVRSPLRVPSPVATFPAAKMTNVSTK